MESVPARIMRPHTRDRARAHAPGAPPFAFVSYIYILSTNPEGIKNHWIPGGMMVDLYRKERRRKRLEREKQEPTTIRRRKSSPYKREKQKNGEYE